MRVHHGPMMKGRSGLCSLRCRFAGAVNAPCYLGRQKKVTTTIRRVITERLNEIGAIRRKTTFFVRTNDLALTTTTV